jgi:hypothetical protein
MDDKDKLIQELQQKVCRSGIQSGLSSWYFDRSKDSI